MLPNETPIVPKRTIGEQHRLATETGLFDAHLTDSCEYN